jgi:hypothetical protein
VFEEDFNLFTSAGRTSKTLLLFAIRDWQPRVPPETIRKQLSKDMDTMWSSINKVFKFILILPII